MFALVRWCEFPIPCKSVQIENSPQHAKLQPNEVQTTRIEQPGVGICHVPILDLMPAEALAVPMAYWQHDALNDGIEGLVAGFTWFRNILHVFGMYLHVYIYA